MDDRSLQFVDAKTVLNSTKEEDYEKLHKGFVEHETQLRRQVLETIPRIKKLV